MPVIKVWCLPKSKEKKLNKLHKAIVDSVLSCSELKLKDEKDMTVLFPTDMMKYGLGTVIIVEVSLFKKQERTIIVIQKLAKALGESVYQLFPDAKVECSIESTDPKKEGFWTSVS